MALGVDLFFFFFSKTDSQGREEEEEEEGLFKANAVNEEEIERDCAA